MSFSKVLVALALVVGGPLAAAYADDLNPPPWRGQPGSTFGTWEFSTSDPNPLPEPGSVYPWGPPSTVVTPGLLQTWLPDWNGRFGVWPLSGEIVVEIPNQPLPNPYKVVWIQLTWTEQAPNVFPTVSETRFNIPAGLVNRMPLLNGWFHDTYSIYIEPNPDWERILISGAVNVDEMVIDTICVPEPMTLGLLALGGLALIRRKG